MEEESNQWSEFRTFEVEASADARGKSSSPEDLHLPGAERGKVGEASARERGRWWKKKYKRRGQKGPWEAETIPRQDLFAGSLLRRFVHLVD